MQELHSIVTRHGSVADQCYAFGELLGLTGPVPEDVLRAAVQNSTYAHNLLVARKEKMFLDHLLQHPPAVDDVIGVDVEEEAVQEQTPAESATPVARSNAELVKKATTALWRWSKTGFSMVDEITLQRRRAACNACPHATEPPDKFLYKLTAMQREQAKICGMCGCNLAKKTRLPSESCPDTHPVHAGLTRWEEPIVPDEDDEL